jgi:hypothetical protein
MGLDGLINSAFVQNRLSTFWGTFWFWSICLMVIGVITFLLFRKKPVLQNTINGLFQLGMTIFVYRVKGSTGWLIFGIIGTVSWVISIVVAVLGKKLKITDENIASFAEGANTNFPQIVEGALRYEGIKTMPGKVWIYRVTILNTAEVSKVVEHFNSAGKQNLLNIIKTAADMKQLRDSDVTICYEYSDEAGNLLLTLKFSPSEYKK